MRSIYEINTIFPNDKFESGYTDIFISVYDYCVSNSNINPTTIFLNGKIIGYSLRPDIFVKIMKFYRRTGCINIYTSVVWKINDNIIKLSSDSGRCCRPLVIVENYNDISKLNTLKKQLATGTLHWNKLLGLDVNDENINYNDKFILTDVNKQHLITLINTGKDLTKSIIEYIDVEESNTCMIAMYPIDILENINKQIKYTHLEIDPCLMFGLIPNTIPFIEKNQAPRNQYCCAQSKQALGLYATNYKNRMDTKGQILYYPQRPLAQSDLSQYLNYNMPQGINTIVAIASYGGYNQEDSILINRGAIERGLFTSIKFRTFSDKESIENDIYEEFINPLNTDKKISKLKNANYSKLDENGIIKENIKVNDEYNY